MESLTKNHQDLDTLTALVERAFGKEAIPRNGIEVTEMTEGWFNVAYKISLADGRQVVLKIAPPAHIPVLTRERGMMRAELAAMALIEEHTSVPIPQVYAADLTHELIDADYFFMEFIEGFNFGLAIADGTLSQEVAASGNRQLGRLNREINSVTAERFGNVTGPQFDRWSDAFMQIVEDVLADAAPVDIDLGWSVDELRAVFVDHRAVLDEVRVPRLVEVDLWAKNSIMRDGVLVALLDHERAIFGDPLMEGGLTGLDAPEFGDPTDFMAGFGLESLTESETIRRRLYTLQLGIIMAVETKYRGHTTSEVYDLARRVIDQVMAALGRTR